MFTSNGHGLDPGALWADTLGVSFGAALRWNPYEPIERFLQTVPAANQALPIRLDTWFREGYVADIVIPSPENLIKGYPVEIRAVNADNYAYTMLLSYNPENGEVVFDDARRSAYRLSPNDPWYFSGAPDGRHDDARVINDQHGTYVEPSSAYRAANQQLQSHQEMQARLLNNLGDLQANQRRLDDQMRQQRLTEQQMRYNEQQRWETQRRIDDTNAQLRRNTEILNGVHQQLMAASDQMHNTLMQQAQDHNQQGQLNQQYRLQHEQMERAGREQLNQQDLQRRADEKQREVERKVLEEKQRRDEQQRQLNNVWTFGPPNGPKTIGGQGADIVVHRPSGFPH